MELRPTNRKHRASGFATLAELLVGTMVATILVAGAVSFYCFSLRSFVSMANYTDLNNQSRNASDVLSRDLRSAIYVINLTTNQLVLYGPDKINVTYTFDPLARTLTRVKAGESQTLLKGLDTVTFSLYQRPATNSAYNQFPIATPINAKIVAAQWSCSRIVQGPETDSETIQGAMVTLRNQ